MLGALTVEHLSFKVIRLVIGRCALARFRPGTTKAFLQFSSAFEALQCKFCFFEFTPEDI